MGPEGKQICKPYTPISPLNQKGSVTFVIKIYREHPDFPGKGKFTQALEKISVGQTVNFEGPIGKLKYQGRGKFNFMKKEPFVGKTKICLLAGGTGITPCLSVAQASLLAGEGYEVKLINCNKTKEDILCQKELSHLRENF